MEIRDNDPDGQDAPQKPYYRKKRSGRTERLHPKFTTLK